MSATGAGYDQGVTTFSPDGRVFQVEYAHKAVEKSGTVVGVTCKDGVVMGVEKLILSKMLVEGSNRRVQAVDLYSGLAMAGLQADGRQLVNKCRDESRDYLNFYGHHIPGKVLADRLAGFCHLHTMYWMYRPFGCAVLLANYDSKGPGLYMVDPTGVVNKYFGCAIGKHKNGASTELEKIKFSEITCREAVMEVARIIYKLHDDIKDKQMELELNWTCDESDRKFVRVPKDLREAAVKAALEAKEKAEMDDSESEEEKND